MAQTIKLKRSATQGAIPSTSQLELGEVAINTYDGKMYIKKNDGSESIIEIGQTASFTPAGNVGELQFNDSGSLGAAAFTFIDTVNNRLGIGTDTPSTALEVSGTVTATAFDGSLSWSNITDKPDPTVTLAGDASGSATFTDLGNTTLTVTIANDSHTHDGRYYTETESDNRFVNVSGDSMSGFLTLHADPTQSLHAATKQYVDSVAEGLHAVPSVAAATTTNLAGTYDNGALGVGATLNIGPAATLTIDGISFDTLYQGLLIKNQTVSAQNGRYFVSQVGGASTDWIFTRCEYCDEADEIPGAYIFVDGGNTYGNTGWVAAVENASTFVVGTDNINWFQFAGAGTYTAGTGLVLSGTEFSHSDTSSQASVSNTNGTVIQDITLDGFGHITAIGSKTLTTTDISEGVNEYYTLSRANTAIDGRVTKTFVDALNINADTLDGQHGSYYLNWANVTNKPTLTLDGDVAGSVTFTDLGNTTLTVTVLNNSHTHDGYVEPGDNLSVLTNDLWEITDTVPTSGAGKPAGYVWYIV